MRSRMSFRSKRELLAQVAPRYQQAGHTQKSVILDEFVAATGYARKYAIQLLTQPPCPCLRQIRRHGHHAMERPSRPRSKSRGPLPTVIGTKRLIPFLPKLVPTLGAPWASHAHRRVSRTQLLTLSPATADRLLHRARANGQPHGISTTKAGTLLKRQIPVRTFADWDDAAPAFLRPIWWPIAAIVLTVRFCPRWC